MTTNTLPLLITLGDPAGIGPEVAAKVLFARVSPAAGQRATAVQRPWLLVGSRWALAAGATAAGVRLPELPIVDADSLGAGADILDIANLAKDGGIGFVDIDVARPQDFAFGAVQPACGEAAVRAVEWSAKACLAGRAAGMVTCPINKEAIHAAGYVDDIGHQEILGRLAGVTWTATMLMTPGLKVVHLSTHKSLIEAARYVTYANVLDKLRLTQTTLGGWGMASPRIAVAALNPHGGEGGLIGREEIEEIAPAVAAAREEGINVTGPIPADSVFNRAINGEFDVVMALYHDQGHIAIKVHDFHRSTTATLGIPFVRTSVDHGTAFDIAGAGVADERGLVAAIEAAQALLAGQLGAL